MTPFLLLIPLATALSLSVIVLLIRRWERQEAEQLTRHLLLIWGEGDGDRPHLVSRHDDAA